MNKKLKEYLVSSAISFIACFAIVLVAQIDTITLESFKDGTFIGLVFVCLRAGIKGVLEIIIAKFATK